MKNKHYKRLCILLTILISTGTLHAQDNVWTLEKCINQALENNIDIRKSKVSTKEFKVDLDQAKSNRKPNLSSSASTTFNWDKEQMAESNSYGNRDVNNYTSFGLSSSTSLYNGSKLKNKVKKAAIDFKQQQYSTSTQKETITLSVLEAYLEVLYAKESIKNDSAQIKSTEEELSLAKERLNSGIISLSDYLGIKSELSSEKSTLAEDQGTLSSNLVTLMQLIEIPLNDNFQIETPNLDELLLSSYKTGISTKDAYKQALKIKPQIKEAEMEIKSAELYEKIEKADLYPSLSLKAGLSSGWNDKISSYSYSEQLKNEFSPSVGLSVSIPIFSNYAGRNNVKLAKLYTEESKLEAQNTKNTLRKNIELAYVDLKTATAKYNASLEAYNSAKESGDVATEKYNEGMINSVDLISIKTDLIEAENNLLKQKFNIVFSNKILDFYKGEPINSFK